MRAQLATSAVIKFLHRKRIFDILTYTATLSGSAVSRPKTNEALLSYLFVNLVLKVTAIFFLPSVVHVDALPTR